jgi:hypothetical protein
MNFPNDVHSSKVKDVSKMKSHINSAETGSDVHDASCYPPIIAIATKTNTITS